MSHDQTSTELRDAELSNFLENGNSEPWNPLAPRTEKDPSDLTAHEASNIFPMLEGEEYEQLKTDIREHGQLEPIWVDSDGKILDGRNRYRALRELHLDPKCQTWSGNGSPLDFVLSVNLHRRQPTTIPVSARESTLPRRG
jgi:ParB-like chromosome segregation protein Spo0J